PRSASPIARTENPARPEVDDEPGAVVQAQPAACVSVWPKPGACGPVPDGVVGTLGMSPEHELSDVPGDWGPGFRGVGPPSAARVAPGDGPGGTDGWTVPGTVATVCVHTDGMSEKKRLSRFDVVRSL